MINMIMENIHDQSNSVKPKGSHGGRREGGGRKAGSTNKLTATSLLSALHRDGKNYAEQLAEDYFDAQATGNKELRYKYHNLISNKVFANLNHVEVDETSTVENRQAAFLKALETIGTVANSHDSDGENTE